MIFFSLFSNLHSYSQVNTYNYETIKCHYRIIAIRVGQFKWVNHRYEPELARSEQTILIVCLKSNWIGQIFKDYPIFDSDSHYSLK